MIIFNVGEEGFSKIEYERPSLFTSDTSLNVFDGCLPSLVAEVMETRT